MIEDSQQDSNVPDESLESLAKALEQDKAVTLDEEQIKVVRFMLDRVARDQFLIAALQRRVKRYTEADGEIESEINAVFERIRRHAAESGVDTGFDYESAGRARLEFTREVEQANRSADIFRAVLGLVVRLAPLF